MSHFHAQPWPAASERPLPGAMPHREPFLEFRIRLSFSLAIGDERSW